MSRITLLATLLCLPALAAPASALASSATLTGRILDESGHPVAGARLALIHPLSGFRQHRATDSQGRFTFHNVPFSDYHLEVLAPGFQDVHREVELRSTLPVDLALDLKTAGATVAVEEILSLVESHPSTHLAIERSAIRLASAPVQSRALESILLATPGFAANDNGRFHFRGSHGQLTFVVDGIPLSDHTHATHSNSLDPSQVDSLEVITGGISAEHGGKPVAVVNLTTRSGLGTPGGFAGEVSLGAARFGTFETAFTAQGGADAFGYFVSGAASRSERFLDPVDFRNFHNTGGTGRLFARFDWILGDRDTLRLSLSGGRTRRDVVNLVSQEAAGMDQAVATTDANLSLAWTHLFSARQSLDLSAYGRHATSKLDPTRDLAPGFPAGGPDTPVWARQDRRLGNLGFLAAFNQRFGAESTFKVGIQTVSFPLRETFRFAFTTDDAVVDPASPLYAYTPAGGGALWTFRETLAPNLHSVFAQTDLHLGDLFLALGLRYDRWSLRGLADDALQPRLGASYRFPGTRTTLRASYDRLFITPDRENLALSSSHEAAELGEDDHAGEDHGIHQVRPEVQDAWTVGVEQQLGGWGRVAVDAWQRRSRNTADVAQFLNTGIEFPIAFARGRFHGLNLRFDLVPVAGFSAYLSLARTRALVEGPLVGGLELHAGDDHAHETEGRFPIDHDQKLSAQLGLRYEREGWWLQAQGRHDSGLVAGDPDGAVGNPDLAFGLDLIRFDAADGVWRVKPRTTWNLGGGRTFDLGGRRRLTLAADLLNVFDTRALYNFLSHRGGTHVFPPRTWTARVKYNF